MTAFTRTGLFIILFFAAALFAAFQSEQPALPLLAWSVSATLVGFAYSAQLWTVHQFRFEGLIEGRKVSRDGKTVRINFRDAGMAVCEVEVMQLAFAFATAEANQHKGWFMKSQRLLPAKGGIRLAVLTNGDTTVLNFRAERGRGYRVFVPTRELHLLF